MSDEQIHEQCPFCQEHPFHYVDNGVGMEAVAVTCCDLGNEYYRGMRPIPEEVVLTWDEFNTIARKLDAHSAAAEQYKPLVGAAKALSREMHRYLDDFAPAKYRTPFDALARLDKTLATLEQGGY